MKSNPHFFQLINYFLRHPVPKGKPNLVGPSLRAYKFFIFFKIMSWIIFSGLSQGGNYLEKLRSYRSSNLATAWLGHPIYSRLYLRSSMKTWTLKGDIEKPRAWGILSYLPDHDNVTQLFYIGGYSYLITIPRLRYKTIEIFNKGNFQYKKENHALAAKASNATSILMLYFTWPLPGYGLSHCHHSMCAWVVISGESLIKVLIYGHRLGFWKYSSPPLQKPISNLYL